MDVLQFFMVFSFVLSGLFWMLLFKLPLSKLQEIESDSECIFYKNASNSKKYSESLKDYSKKKYEDRIQYLLKEKGIDPIWWKLYKIGENNYYHEI
jgi:hypothetical protein